MRSMSRLIVSSTLIATLCLLVSNTGHGAPQANRQIAVIDLGAPGVRYSHYQETDVLSPGTLQSIPWLGPKSEDAFVVIDIAALEANGWSLEDPQTGARMSGYALLRTQTALRNPAEKRRTFVNMLGMLAALDSNNDKRIDSRDFVYNVLRLYRDGNNDGKIDADELSTLQDEEIAEIGFIVYGPQKKDAQGNFYQVLRVKKQDGTKIEGHLVTVKSR